MEIKSLTCPRCGSSLKDAGETDMYYCEHCRIKVQISGQSDEFYKSRTRLKEIEAEERIKNMEKELELLKLKQQNKESKRRAFVGFSKTESGGTIFAIVGAILFTIFLIILSKIVK